jgi:hypothetical protein
MWEASQTLATIGRYSGGSASRGMTSFLWNRIFPSREHTSVPCFGRMGSSLPRACRGRRISSSGRSRSSQSDSWRSKSLPLGCALLAYIERYDLRRFVSAREQPILAKSREEANEQHLAEIGWSFEGAWALAWILGFGDSLPYSDMIPDEIVGGFQRFRAQPQYGFGGLDHHASAA